MGGCGSDGSSIDASLTEQEAALRQRLAARSERALGQDEVGGSQGTKRKLREDDSDEMEGEGSGGAVRGVSPTSRSESRSAPAQSTTPEPYQRAPTWSALRRSNHPPIAPSRSIYSYERLNQIQEGTYGVVFRARPREPLSPPGPSSVAVKKLKLPPSSLHSGFPITSLREISTLSASRDHPHIVTLHEVCIGNTIDQIFLVLEFMEHDLKTLLTSMHRSAGTGFAPSEIKTLMFQLCEAVAGLHDGWVVHRDLKSSNLLMDNRGRLKVGDFGLARRFGDPIDGWRGAGERAEAGGQKRQEGEELGDGGMTDLVCTLWYRAPELLHLNLIHQSRESSPSTKPPSTSTSSHPLSKLHSNASTTAPPPPPSLPLYDEKIDMWSIGCIFAELLLTSTAGAGLFQGKDEADQLRKIESILGRPNTTIWPDLPLWSGVLAAQPQPSNPSSSALRREEHRIKQNLTSAFHPTKLTPATLDLLFHLLHWDPKQRISAKAALKHEYFTREKPTMAHPDSFGSFPSSAAGEKQVDTPSAPDRRGLGAGRKASAAEVRAGKQYKMEFDFTG
ncbi:hypothetical protein PHSY_007134 [Pseudozyma hubeiensis SY62]|uniref:Protein kinase domain-containing protein n=1 Tax=Pseudozyma hubeiensis (strain SY62) TaxID=1305764 RepID=R9PE51_PSEHS|nr:hypothetical protein PHSY_007134 [Pseudozyma hubeiensis SY62]GAC99532.1 hypothetical protein PHSY_007134 [Pseudozyma hubeiensis SY62]